MRTYSKFGCSASLCYSQSSADGLSLYHFIVYNNYYACVPHAGDEHLQIQLQSSKQVMDENTQDKDKYTLPGNLIMHIEDKPITNASGETECICTDTSAKNHPGEVAITTQGDSLYSEVVPSNKRKKHASTSSADVKAGNVYSEPTEAPTKGYTSLVFAGGQEDTGAQPQEALYDQPVSLTVLCWVSTFKFIYY